MNLVNPSKCTGCRACYSICPHHAIVMRPDKNGFPYPAIQKKECVECGLCRDICPVIHVSASVPPKSCFVAETLNRELHKASSSGGVFGELAISALGQGGFVVGCGWDYNTIKARHIIVEDEKQLAQLFGSKYVQSDLGNTLVETKRLLDSHKKVLFSGTPCQIAGLKSFLGKEYDNLLTVEVICHGVPSPSVFERYKKESEKKHKAVLIDINFRAKDHVYEGDYISLKFKKTTVKSKRKDDSFFKSFVQNFILRKSCFNCCSNDGKSGADITIGDFWGIQKIIPGYHAYGHSAVIIRSENGMQAWNEIKQGLLFKEMSYKDIYNENPVCKESVSKPFAYNFYMCFYKVLGLKKALQVSRLLNRTKGFFHK